MSLNAYKISLKFYTSYLNNKLQQIIDSYISLLKYHGKILRNLAGLAATRKSSTGKLVSSPENRLVLQGSTG